MHRISTLDVLENARKVKRRDPSLISIWWAEETAKETLNQHLGSPWRKRCVSQLPPYLSPPDQRERAMRYIELAEACLNLQNVRQYESVWRRLRTDDVESEAIPLKFGKWLTLFSIPFCFVDPKGKRSGEAYDLELEYQNQKLACEIKTKVETTMRSASTILSSLREAAAQLPRDQPSMIGVGIPSHWTVPGAIKWNDLFEDATKQLFACPDTRHVNATFVQSFLRDSDYQRTAHFSTRPLVNPNALIPVAGLPDMFPQPQLAPITPKNEKWPTIGELLRIF